MAFTGKQERNGTNIGAPGHNSAIANEGPMPAIPMAQAMAAADGTYNTPGHSVFLGGGQEGMVSMEWDAGLAINDVEGGGSG